MKEKMNKFTTIVHVSVTSSGDDPAWACVQ